MFKSVRVYINKAAVEPVKEMAEPSHSLFLPVLLDAASSGRKPTQHHQETILPLSDLPEDLLVLESRRDEKDEDGIDDDEGVEQQEQTLEQEPREQEQANATASRFTIMQNYISHKLKKIYFDSRINSHDGDGFLSKVLKGESVGIMVGSQGIASAAHKHPVFESLIAEIKEDSVATILETVEMFMGRFAITDSKLMDLNSERNVPLESFVEKDHVVQKVSTDNVKDFLAAPSLTSLSSCTILYFKSSPTIVGKLYLIDIKEPDFGMSQEDKSSSSISLTSLQGKLRESMLKLSSITKILGNAGAEGILDFNFPLGVCCRELFGGRAHAYLSFDLMDSSSVSDAQLSHFFEFCCSVRRIRNRIESNLVDSTLISLQEKLSKLENDCFEQCRKLEEKENVASELKDTCKDLNEKVDEYRQEITSLQSQLSDLTLQCQEKEKETNVAVSELTSKLEHASLELQTHLEQCQQEKHQSNVVQIQVLKDSVTAAERVGAIDIQLLKTKVLEYQTSLFESQAEKRTLQAKNAVLEYEKSHFAENISFYTSLHEKDLASILKVKQDLALLKEKRNELHADFELSTKKYEESQLVISSLKDESRDLTKQLVTMQQQLLDRTDSAFAQASKQDQKLYNDFLDKSQQTDSLKLQLEEAEHAKLTLQSRVEKVEMKLTSAEEKLSSKMAEFSALQNRLEKMETKCTSLVKENTLLRDKVDEYLSNDAAVTRNGLQQTLSLLETKLDSSKSAAASTASLEQASYQEKLEEARRSQINMMEKMIERESAWAKEKLELLLVKKSSTEEMQKATSPQKRTITQVEQENENGNGSSENKAQVKKIKSKKTTDPSTAAETSKKATKEPKVKKARKTVVAEVETLEKDELEQEDSLEDDVEKTSKTASKPKLKPVKKAAVPSQSSASNSVQSILKAAQGQVDVSVDTSSSENEDDAPVAIKKKIGKKKVVSSLLAPKETVANSKSVDIPMESTAAKENTKPATTAPGRISLFSKKDTPSTTAGAAPRLKGLLGGFLKRPNATTTFAPSESAPNADDASVLQDAAAAAIQGGSDLLPKIPKKYLDQRRLNMLLN